jgi:esterase/lipase
MSTPYQLGPDPRLVLLPLLSRVIPYLPKGGSDWVDPDAGKDRVSYSKYPTKGLLELNQLLEKMRETLPAVTVPALLLHSKGDGLFNFENMQNIYHTLGTQEGRKTTVLLENSGHIITKDLDKMIVFRSIVDFIQQTLSQDQ